MNRKRQKTTGDTENYSQQKCINSQCFHGEQQLWLCGLFFYCKSCRWHIMTRDLDITERWQTLSLANVLWSVSYAGSRIIPQLLTVLYNYLFIFFPLVAFSLAGSQAGCWSQFLPGAGRVHPWMRSMLHQVFTHWGHEQDRSEGSHRQGRSTHVSLQCVSIRAQHQWHQGHQAEPLGDEWLFHTSVHSSVRYYYIM